MDLKEEHILGNGISEHWYYLAKGRAVRDFLGKTKVSEVLDVGAGSGIFSRQLLDAGVCERAVCVDPNYAHEYEEQHNGKTIKFVKRISSAPQTLALLMDVLEHVDDDMGLLRQYSDKMEWGSKILITVPAFEFLWSGHDVFLEHKRRYTARQVEALVERAGLRVVKTRYFFGLLFPIVALLRLRNRIRATKPRSDLRRYPRWLNRILVIIHDIERYVLFPFNKGAGLSVICLCEKK